jgi:hypothetical protein
LLEEQKNYGEIAFMKRIVSLLLCFSVLAPQAWGEDWVLKPESLRLNIGTRSGGEKQAPVPLATPSFLGMAPIGMGAAPYPSAVRSELRLLNAEDEQPIVWFAPDVNKSSSLLLPRQIPSCMPDEGVMITSRAKAWETAYGCLRELSVIDSKSGKSRLSMLGGEQEQGGIVAIEPVLDLVDARAKKKAHELTADERADTVTPASPVWPSAMPGWHLQQTGLATAYAKVFERGPENRSHVVIAHLDTGYFPGDRHLPAFFNRQLSTTCFADRCEGTGEANWSADGLLKMPDHGTGTLSNLAGALWDEKHKPLSGNPSAVVFSINIHDSVVHVDSRRMARGIEEAVERQADVITLSHGGLPSQRLASAVNRAYQKGTPIFAASGDFFEAPFFLGRSFRSVVFPARYANVMGVTGATQENESYGENPSLKWWFAFGHDYFSNLGSWALRGNFGPTYVMSQDTKIAAYAPNITRSKANPKHGSSVGNDGAGTSNATPQVAAAASLWLEKNRLQFSDKEWRSWQKSEAVYQALSHSANSCFAQYDSRHFGAGIVQADKALQWEFVKQSEQPQIRATGATTVALAERKEVPIDIAGAAELLSSVSLPSDVADNFKEAFFNALLTELSQLVFTSEKLQEYLQRFHVCAPSPECGRCTRQDLAVNWQRVSTIIDDLDDASPTLKCQLARGSGADKASQFCAGGGGRTGAL